MNNQNKMPNIQKAKEGKKIKGELMLSQSPLSVKQLLYILQRTPTKHIYSRPGKKGIKFEYVTGTYIKKVLNYTFGWMWSFEVKEHGREGDLMWVLGKLTIQDKTGKAMIIKEQFGRADIKFLKDTKITVDFGNDLKAATTDALKKCASELGIASDVYGRQEFKEIQKIDKRFIPPNGENGKEASKNAENSTNTGGLSSASEIDKKRIVDITRKLGAKTAQATARMVENVVKGKVDWTKMTKNQATIIYAILLRRKINKK